MHDENPQPLRALDTFDPSEDGWSAISLEDVVEAGKAAEEALKAYRLALYGCRTPLNLKSTETSLLTATDAVRQTVKTLEGARRVIESDTPLAIRYPGKDPWTAETGGVLSPKQILSLARRANDVQPAAHVSYRAVIEEMNPIPTLLAKDRSMGFSTGGSTDMDEVNDRRTEFRDKLVREILAGLESVECGYCHAPAGSPCVTASGGIAHLSHKPRQDAYPMKPEHAWVSAYVNRQPHNEAVYPEVRGKSWMERRENGLRENRNLVNEVVEDIAGTLSDLSR